MHTMLKLQGILDMLRAAGIGAVPNAILPVIFRNIIKFNLNLTSACNNYPIFKGI